MDKSARYQLLILLVAGNWPDLLIYQQLFPDIKLLGHSQCGVPSMMSAMNRSAALVQQRRPFALPCRPEMVVGWYHSHPGFGCWLSGVDINTQQVG